MPRSSVSWIKINSKHHKMDRKILLVTAVLVTVCAINGQNHERAHGHHDVFLEPQYHEYHYQQHIHEEQGGLQRQVHEHKSKYGKHAHDSHQHGNERRHKVPKKFQDSKYEEYVQDPRYEPQNYRQQEQNTDYDGQYEINFSSNEHKNNYEQFHHNDHNNSHEKHHKKGKENASKNQDIKRQVTTKNIPQFIEHHYYNRAEDIKQDQSPKKQATPPPKEQEKDQEVEEDENEAEGAQNKKANDKKQKNQKGKNKNQEVRDIKREASAMKYEEPNKKQQEQSKNGESIQKHGIRRNDYYPYPKYQFSYGLQDPHKYEIRHHYERHDGEVLNGEYSVQQPDGTIRIVEYQAYEKKIDSTPAE